MQKRLTRLIALVMVGMMIMACPTLSLAASPRYGDPDNSGTVDATDALLVLRAAVKKMEPTKEQTVAGDVNGDQKLDASDALLILQYAVKKISSFPVEAHSEKGYYDQRNEAYQVDFSDFGEITTIKNVDNAEELMTKLGGDPPEAPVETADVTADGLISYTPISDEAIRLDQTQKYKFYNKTSGSLKLGNTELTYSIPSFATAYDAVPIEYSLVSTGNTPVHLEAVAFEEAERYQDPAVDYYDCNMPGTVAIEFEYLGYVNGTRNDALRPSVTPYVHNDKLGQAYPAYTTTPLTYSGTIDSNADYTWLKWKFTNTGNTILDGEGNSAFRFNPMVYQKTASGWTYVGRIYNWRYPLLDYVYPGESGEFWTQFYMEKDGATSFEPGEYRIVLDGYLRSEQKNFNPAGNLVDGAAVTSSTFEFTVAENAAVTTPNQVVNTHVNSIPRNGWLGNFEEFMSSYTTVLKPGKVVTTATKGTLYVQPAPWTKQIVLKVIHGDKQEIETVRIPLHVESDSIQINLNTDNRHWVVKEDGTRTPMVYTQEMENMRGHVKMGPYADSYLVNELRNMKEAGINTLTTTHVFTGLFNGHYDMSMFMLDCARQMGFAYEGHTTYYYRYQSCIDRVRAFEKNLNLGSRKDLFNKSSIDAANGVLARWNFIRYGDFAVYDKTNGVVPISSDENYGWLTYQWNNRDGIGNVYSDRLFYKWLEEAYDFDINELNEKYGTDFIDFNKLKLSDYTVWDGVGYQINHPAFQNQSAGTADLDIFRTAERTRQYAEMLKYADIENAKVYVRSENALFLAPAISPTTTNPRYRQLYYELRQCASIPEILAASGTVYGYSSVNWVPFRPSEVYELTRQAAKIDMQTALMIPAAHMTDTVINNTVGSARYHDDLSTGDQTVGCIVNSQISAFTWFKAIYEAGGVPGVMWMDYNCDLYVTTTQYRELQFFNQKINEMLSTEEGKAWATNLPAESLVSPLKGLAKTAYSYPEEYVANALATIPRQNMIMSFVSKNSDQ